MRTTLLLLLLAACGAPNKPDDESTGSTGEATSGADDSSSSSGTGEVLFCVGDVCEDDDDCGAGLKCFADIPKQVPFCGVPCGHNCGSPGEECDEETGVCRGEDGKPINLGACFTGV